MGDTEDDNYSTPLEGIRKTSDKSSSYHRQNSAPHVHFEVTSSHPTSSQYSPALSTASTSSSASSPNSLAKKIGITIKKSPNSDRTFETSLLGLTIDKEDITSSGNKRSDETDDDTDEDDDNSSNDGINIMDNSMDSESSSSSSSSSSSNIDSSSDSEVRFKSSAIIAEFKRNKKMKKNKKKQKKKKRHRSKSSIGDLDVSNYSKKLLDRNKTPKVSLDKCEADNHLLKIGTKTNDNTTANLLRSFPLV